MPERSIPEDELDELRQEAIEHLWVHTAASEDMEAPGGIRVVTSAQGSQVTDAEGNTFYDPMGGLEVLLNATAGEVDETIERPGTEVLAPLWTDGVKTFGWQTRERWQAFTTWMQENGLLLPGVAPDSAFTNRFVEETSQGE